ncbi:MAG: hypothetical protein IJ156_00740 [Bacteroidales bacterium]|nr:hypothetical protein [Bacteroidales bacterium]
MNGWEAQVWLRYWLEHDGALEDPAVDYLAERVEEMDAAALLEAMGIIRKRLSEMGELKGTDTGERIRITRDFRILLPERFDTEIRLRPLVKTVFLLFLRHPEGIRFGALQDYRKEMTDLYMGISRSTDAETVRERIGRLTDPKDNSIHEKAANLSAALSRYFKPSELPAYTLTGKAGAPKRIRLDRALVEWE